MVETAPRCGPVHRSLAMVAVLAGLLANMAQASTSSLRCTRGTLVVRELLTGRVEAEDSVMLPVPPSPEWRTAVTWLAEEGSRVERGDRVAELDSSSFRSTLQDRRLAALRARLSLEKARAKAEGERMDAELEVERADNALAVAKLDAGVPERLLPRREVEERRLAVARATADLQSAKADLEAAIRKGQADVRIARLDLARAERQVREAEEAIERYVLPAPRSGVVVIPEHPWEGRKIAVGDTLFVGYPVVEIAGLDGLFVRAALPDAHDGRVTPGMPAVCVPDMHPELELHGSVRSVTAVARAPERDSLRRVFDVIVSLDDPPKDVLRPGMQVRVEVETVRRPDVLMVPRAALSWEGDSPRVRLADGETREVELGPCSAEACEVTRGLGEGEELLGAERGGA